jgi:hypothetical protein
VSTGGGPRRAAALALLAAALVVGCSGPSSVPVPPPHGPAAGCSTLSHDLPGSVDGRKQRDTSPASTRTAAWGDPAVVLRCGVGRPAGLQPTSQVVEVNGVEWFLGGDDPPYVLTTVGRGTYVQVRLPRDVPRGEVTASLVDLARPVKRAMPVR